MKDVQTATIDTESKKRIDRCQEENGFETGSEGALQVLKRDLEYCMDIKTLHEGPRDLQSSQKHLCLAYSVCGKQMDIGEPMNENFHKNIKEHYIKWYHSSYIFDNTSYICLPYIRYMIFLLSYNNIITFFPIFNHNIYRGSDRKRFMCLFPKIDYEYFREKTEVY